MSKSAKNSFAFRAMISMVNVCFILSIIAPSISHAQTPTDLGLPAAGTMLNLTAAYKPVIVKGLRIHPENPVLFDFIFDTGDTRLSSSDPQLKTEAEKLVKYFLASLTVADGDQWVNLSPYEKDRTIPDALAQTEMGRDMLAQDYVLKQLTASLIYPEKELGKEFWSKVYAKAQALYGSSEIPVNTFNKVWIVADKADVFVHDNTAFVVQAHLKVMLEEDYLASSKNAVGAPLAGALNQAGASPARTAINNTIGSQIIREIVLPELDKEVNSGKHFANLRQIFYSMILANWYKKNLKEALLNQVYANKAKLNGVDVADKSIKDQIYQEYLRAYKKGVFNYIKEDLVNGQPAPKKYFSGGVAPNFDLAEVATSRTEPARGDNLTGNLVTGEVLAARNSGVNPDAAMMTEEVSVVRPPFYSQAVEGSKIHETGVSNHSWSLKFLPTDKGFVVEIILKHHTGQKTNVPGFNLGMDQPIARERMKTIEGFLATRLQGQDLFKFNPDNLINGVIQAVKEDDVRRSFERKAKAFMDLREKRNLGGDIKTVDFAPKGFEGSVFVVSDSSPAANVLRLIENSIAQYGILKQAVHDGNRLVAFEPEVLAQIEELFLSADSAMLAAGSSTKLSRGQVKTFVLGSNRFEVSVADEDAVSANVTVNSRGSYLVDASNKYESARIRVSADSDGILVTNLSDDPMEVTDAAMTVSSSVIKSVLNDGVAAVLGEVPGFNGGSGIAVIIGTGIGGAVADAQGRVITENGAIREIGHHIIKGTDGKWRFTGKESPDPKYKKKVGETSIEDNFRGLAIAKRFSMTQGAARLLMLKNPKLPAGITSVDGLLDLIDENLGEADPKRQELQKEAADVLLRAVTDLINDNNREVASFVKDLGEEFGKAIAALFAEFPQSAWTENLVLVSGIGENFAKPSAGNEDVFITSIRASLSKDLTERKIEGLTTDKITKMSQGLRRSSMSWEREILAFRQQSNVLAFSIGGTKIGVGVVNDKDQVVQSSLLKREWNAQDASSLDAFVLKMAQLALEAMRAGGIDPKSLAKIGISYAGSVNEATGEIGYEFVNPNLPSFLSKVALADLVEKKIRSLLDQAMTAEAVSLKNLKNEGQHEGVKLDVNGNTALIDPEIGTLQSLIINGTEIYVPGKGNPPMAFWTSRLPDGKAQFMGRTVDFKTNPLIRWFKDKHGLHGLLGHATSQETVKWTVEEKGTDERGAFVVLSIDTTKPEYQLLKNDVFGRVKVSLIYRFDGTSINTEWVVENKDDKVIPWSGGSHPFMDLGNRNEWSVRVHANQYWQVNDDRIPELKPAQDVITGSPQDFRQWVSLKDLKSTIEVPLTALAPDQDGLVAEFRNDRTGEIRRFYQERNQANGMLWIPVGAAGLENTVSWQSIPGAPSALYLEENGIKGNGLVMIQPGKSWRTSSKMDVSQKSELKVIDVMQATNQIGAVSDLLAKVRLAKMFSYSPRVKQLAIQYVRGVDVLNALNEVKKEFGKGNEYLAQQFLDAVWLTSRWGLDESFMRQLILNYMMIDKIDAGKLSQSSRAILQASMKDMENDAKVLWNRWQFLQGQKFHPETTLKSIEESFSNEGATRVIKEKIAALLGDGVDIQIGARSGPSGHMRAFIKDKQSEPFAAQFYARSMFVSQGSKGEELLASLIEQGVVQVVSPEILRLRKELDPFKDKIVDALGQDFFDAWRTMPTVPEKLINEALKPSVISNIFHINHFTLTFDILDAPKDAAMIVAQELTRPETIAKGESRLLPYGKNVTIVKNSGVKYTIYLTSSESVVIWEDSSPLPGFKLKRTVEGMFKITKNKASVLIENISDKELLLSPQDAAMFAGLRPVSNSPVGGIDLNAKNLTTTLSGEKIDIRFDPALIEQFKQGNFNGLHPVIIRFTPIANIYPLLGLKEEEVTAKSAKV